MKSIINSLYNFFNNLVLKISSAGVDGIILVVMVMLFVFILLFYLLPAIRKK